MNLSTATRISRLPTSVMTPFFSEQLAAKGSDSYQGRMTDSQSELIWPARWLRKQVFQKIKEEVTDTLPQVDEDALQSARRQEYPPKLLADIGWSQAEAFETRARLGAFEEDWNAPGMDAYDEL